MKVKKFLVLLFCISACCLLCLSGCSSKKSKKGELDEFDDNKGVNWCSYKDIESKLEDLGFQKTESKYISNMASYKQDVYKMKDYSYLEVNVEYFEDDPENLLRKLLIFYEGGEEDAVISAIKVAGFVRDEDRDLAIESVKTQNVLQEEMIDSAELTVVYDEEIGSKVELSPTNPRSEYEIRNLDSDKTE